MTRKTIKENDSWVNPGAPAERSFIGFHRANVAHIDPTDPDVATNNDPVFNGSNVRTYERSVNRMGYDRDDDYNHYDNFRAWRDGQLAAIRRYSTGQQAIVPYDQHNSKHDDWVRGFTSVSRMFEQVAEEQQLIESISSKWTAAHQQAYDEGYASWKKYVKDKKGAVYPTNPHPSGDGRMHAWELGAEKAYNDHLNSRDDKRTNESFSNWITHPKLTESANETHATADGDVYTKHGPIVIHTSRNGGAVNRVLKIDDHSGKFWHGIKSGRNLVPKGGQPGLHEGVFDLITRPVAKVKATIRGMRGHGMKDYMRGEGMPERRDRIGRSVVLSGRRMKDHMAKVHAGIGNTITHWDNAIKNQAAELKAFDQATDRLKNNLERYAGKDLVGVHAAALAAKYHPNLYKRPGDTSHKQAVQRAYKQLSLMRKQDGIHPLDGQHPSNRTYTKALVRGHTATSFLKARNDNMQKTAAAKRRKTRAAARKDQ
jgi:hypothetical protein